MPSPDRFSFVLTGKIKPYVRMTARGKYVKQQAQEYLHSKYAMSLQFAEQMIHAGLQTFDKADKLSMTALIVRREQRGDIDNLIKAILDAGNGVVYADDRQLRKVDVTLVDDTNCEPYAQIYFEILRGKSWDIKRMLLDLWEKKSILSACWGFVYSGFCARS